MSFRRQDPVCPSEHNRIWSVHKARIHFAQERVIILSLRKTIIPLLCTSLLIGGMVWAADHFQNPEILFPEVAAIATGAILHPKLAWRTDALHTFAAIAVCAVLGLCIVLWMPGAVWVQMSAAYLLTSVVFLLSRTSFAPMLSAAVLPVMLQTSSIIYPIAACILTASVLLVREILIRCGIRERVPFEKLPSPTPNACLQAALRWLIASVVIFAALRCGFRFAAAPPLLVAFTEFWKPDAVSRKRPVAVISLLTLCAASGACLRYLLCVQLSLPAFVAAILTMLSVFGIMQGLKLMLPPAAAIAILAFLIPASALPLFPLQILCGIAILVGASYLYREKAPEKQMAQSPT